MTRYRSIFLWALLGVLLWSSALMTGGCAKNRLFTHVDSIPEVPNQFHFFNAFCYDSSLSFSIDGLLRENVPAFSMSQYYPSSSAFNLNAEQPNSKLVVINDPKNTAQFFSQNTFQFEPQVSYLVYPTFPAYDTLYGPQRGSVAPTLAYIPEDVNTPFDGTARVRVLSMLAGGTSTSMSVAPDQGAGTTLNLNTNVYYPTPGIASSYYTSTEPGTKVIKVTVNGSTALQLTYLPVALGNHNYTFFEVGDAKNYLNGKEKLPALYMLQDGDPTTLKALTLSSLTYPGNASTVAAVTVINDAYNLPGLLAVGDPANPTYYTYIHVAFNQSSTTVIRWPTAGSPPFEDIGDAYDLAMSYSPPFPAKLLGSPGRTSNLQLKPGIYTVGVTPQGSFGPLYDQFTYSFEQGIGYTVYLMPNDTSATHCGAMVVQNSLAPDPAVFKLRIINVMGGAPQVDVHVGSPTGPLLASDVPYGQQTDYLSLPPTSVNQQLYVTLAGSGTVLMPTSVHPTDPNLVISMPYTAGNCATLSLMGLVPGTPYSGYGGAFGPYALYTTDSYINLNNAYSGGRPIQLYY